MSDDTKVYTPLIQQTGAAYGTIPAHQPVRLDPTLGAKLVKTKNWVEGLSDVAKKRQEAQKEALAESAAAEADATAKKTSEAPVKKDAKS